MISKVLPLLAAFRIFLVQPYDLLPVIVKPCLHLFHVSPHSHFLRHSIADHDLVSLEEETPIKIMVYVERPLLEQGL